VKEFGVAICLAAGARAMWRDGTDQGSAWQHQYELTSHDRDGGSAMRLSSARSGYVGPTQQSSHETGAYRSVRSMEGGHVRIAARVLDLQQVTTAAPPAAALPWHWRAECGRLCELASIDLDHRVARAAHDSGGRPSRLEPDVDRLRARMRPKGWPFSPVRLRCRKLPAASSVQDPMAAAAAWRSTDL
jgi:hypothetical protein